MKRELISFDESGFKSQVAFLKDHIIFLQPVIDEFQRITEKQATIEDFNRLLIIPLNRVDEKAVKECVLDKIIGETKLPLIGNLILKKDKVYDMYEMPDLSVIFQLISNLTTGSARSGYFDKKFFSISNGQLILNQKVLEDEMEKFKIYAETDKERRRLNLIKSICKAFEEIFNTLDYKGPEILEKYQIPGVIRISDSKVEFNPQFVKTGEIERQINYGQHWSQYVELVVNMPASELLK